MASTAKKINTLLPWIAFVIAISITVTWYYIADLRKKEDFHRNFTNLATIAEWHLKDSLDKNSQTLDALRGLYAASKSVDKEEWDAFIKSLSFDSLSHQQTLLYYLDHAEMSPTNFIWGTPDKDRLSTLTGHIKKSAIHESLIYLNSYIAIAAVRTNRIPEFPFEIVFVTPIYENGPHLKTVMQRQAAIKGYIVQSLSMELVAKDFPASLLENLDIDIFNGNNFSSDNIIFDSYEDLFDTASKADDNNLVVKMVNFKNLDWQMRFMPSMMFYKNYRNNLPLAILLIGIPLCVIFLVFFKDWNNQWQLGQSSVVLMLKIGLVIFATEALIMAVIPYYQIFFGDGEMAELLIDSVSLLVITTPIIYFWIIKPLDYQLAQKIAQLRSDMDIRLNAEKELRDTREKLFQSQKLEVIGQLAGGVAHDFNNMLGGILGYTSLLKDKYADDQKTMRQLSIIQQSAERGASLTRNLLGFARKGNYESVIISLNETVEEARAMLVHSLDKNIAVVIDVQKDLWQIKGDSTQLFQVILNLGVNARDAMPCGGTLTIQTRNLWVDKSLCHNIAGLAEGKHVLVTVTDTGTGIPEDIRKRIFEPFYTTKGEGKGTGLGLSMIDGIIANHHGLIRLHSEEGKGTSFFIYLPAIENPLSQNITTTTPELEQTL